MVNVTATTLQNLGLPRVYQLGVIVRDMNKAIDYYSRIMGIQPWYRGNVGEQETWFRGKKVNMDVDMVFAYSGKLMIELIEVKGGDDNIYSEHLAAQGEGLHHLGIEVSDFDAKMKKVEAMGIPIIQSGVVKSKGGAISKMAYLDTTSALGYPIELMETRLFGLALGKGKLLMNIGCLLGDASKIRV